MFIKVIKSAQRYKKIQELVIYVPLAEKDNWLEVDGVFSLDQYFDSFEKVLIPYPTKPHPTAIFNFDTLKWETSYADLMFDIRYARKLLLTQSDGDIAKYTDLGKPIPAEWIAYRQALRDLPNQPGVPYDVIWPEKPAN